MRESHGHPRVPMQSADEPGQGHENIQQLVTLADPLLHPFLKRCLEVIEKGPRLVPLSWGWTGMDCMLLQFHGSSGALA